MHSPRKPKSYEMIKKGHEYMNTKEKIMCTIYTTDLLKITSDLVLKSELKMVTTGLS